MTNVIRAAMNDLPGHWVKGKYSDGKGNHCGLGHVIKNLNRGLDGAYTSDFKDIYNVLGDVALEQFPERVGGAPDFAAFNDHPDTTEEEVLRLMEKAAVELDSRVDFASGV